MTGSDSIFNEIRRLETEAYQRGWNDAVARILAAAAEKGQPPEQAPHEGPAPQEIDGPRRSNLPIIAVIRDIITEHPGKRGADIFRIAVERVPGADFKKMDRTGRTALRRLKRRGYVHQRNRRWYPKKVEENG